MADTMLDWSRSWTAHWRVHRVDRETWADSDELDGVTALTVQRDATGDAPLIETAAMTVVGVEPDADYYRLVLVAEQDGTWERQDIATLLYERTGGTSDHGVTTTSMEGHSVLWPASMRRILLDAYAPAGANGAEYAARLLRACVHSPVVVEGRGFVLCGNVVHEPDMTYLEAAWDVLRAGGHAIAIEGDGTVRIRPQPTEPSLTLDAASAALLRPGVKHELDLSDVPNRYTAVSELEAATVVNDDPTSPTSTVSRGYVVDEWDGSPVQVDGETLAAYARRRLREASTVGSPRTYTRKWVPGVYPGDVVRGAIGSVGLDGPMRVQTQRLECGAGITVTEKAMTEVATWQG